MFKYMPNRPDTKQWSLITACKHNDRFAHKCFNNRPIILVQAEDTICLLHVYNQSWVEQNSPIMK